MTARKTCPHSGKRTDVAASLNIYYTHDYHAFTRLTGNVDAVIDQARRLGVESPYGMMSSVIVLDGDGEELRRVGKSIHARRRGGFAEADLTAWRANVLADDDVRRLMESA